MYNIRLAEEEDLDAVVKMGLKFLTTMEISKMIPVDEDSTYAQALTLLDHGFILLVETEEKEPVGMLGALFSDYPFNRDFTLCTEVMYWLEEDHRGGHLASRMIKEAEKLAVHEGAIAIVMAALETSPEAIELFYHKHGYRRSERAFVKGV